MKKIKLHIEGMMCNNCKQHVEEALRGAATNAEITVDLEAGQAVVAGEELPAADVLKLAVEEAGYDVTGIDVE